VGNKMKLYKDATGKVFGFDAWQKVPTELTELTSEEVEAHTNPVVIPTTAQLIAKLTAERQAQEAQGVTINSIRYAGDPGNRQALQEAIAFMNDAGLTEFTKWKDSDNQFHVDHPLADVVQAYRAIGIQRVTLIATEGNYAQQITAGKLTDLKKVTW